MKNFFILIFLSITLQVAAQQQTFFNFTDTVFNNGSIKRIPMMYHDLCYTTVCGPDGPLMLDSIALFLQQNGTIVLELGVYSANEKVDTEDAEYLKSLLIKRGVAAERIVTKGYGYDGHQLYSQQMIKAAFKKNEEAGKKMFYANFRVELKILQQ